MKTKKKFDCIEMKDEAQRQRAEQLRGLSEQELLEFHRRRHEALVDRQEQLRNQPPPLP